MRVVLFTDTLGDVNGVSRFIRNAAATALATGRELHVVTSTNFEIPDQPNMHNCKPLLAMKMPKYENLELVLPPRNLAAKARSLRPDVIHVSTPGSVGLVGVRTARALGVPLAGVYHTDFPAYIDHLFQDDILTQWTGRYMSRFYARFSAIFTRSDSYAAAVRSLGVPADRLVSLRPGIVTEQFHPRYRNGHISGPVRVLYVGRVSVEKNLPMLAKVWTLADLELRTRGVDAELAIVGDGPYRAEMERTLAPTRTRFLGFKHGEELSRAYAQSDLFAFPSTTDTLGQVVMEAQSSGVPVLVTDQGGPKEVVQEGVTGCVLPAAATALWARTLVDLVCDTPRRRRMSLAAHEFMQEFSMERSFEHFWEVHDRVRRGERPGS